MRRQNNTAFFSDEVKVVLAGGDVVCVQENKVVKDESGLGNRLVRVKLFEGKLTLGLETNRHPVVETGHQINVDLVGQRTGLYLRTPVFLPSGPWVFYAANLDV